MFPKETTYESGKDFTSTRSVTKPNNGDYCGIKSEHMQRIVRYLLLVLIHLPLRSQGNLTADSNQQLRVYPATQKLSHYEPYFFMINILYAEQLSFDSTLHCYVSRGLKKISDPDRFRDHYFTREEKYAIQNNPLKLLDAKLGFLQDIPPVNQELPDGEYVLYYANVPYHESDHVLRYRNDLVAARFHLVHQQLHGKAYWFSPAGDTIRKGSFVEGKREGNWFILLDDQYYHLQYTNGLLNGEFRICFYDDSPSIIGHHTLHKPDGEWTFYHFNGTIYKRYTVAPDSLKATNILIRQKFLYPAYTTNLTDLNTCDLYHIPFNMHFDILNPRDKPFPDFSGLPPFPDEYHHSLNDDDDFNHIDRYLATFQVENMGHLIQSYGYHSYYQGLYAEYYDNGQLYFRFTTENGVIDEPDTVFWENGKPMNVLSDFYGLYTESVFNPEGKLMYMNYYDKYGEPIEWLCNPKICSRVQLSRKPQRRQRTYNYVFMHYENKAPRPPYKTLICHISETDCERYYTNQPHTQCSCTE